MSSITANLTPEIFRYKDGEEVDAQAEIEKLISRLGECTDFPDEARPFVLKMTAPRDYDRVNNLHIGTSTITPSVSKELFDPYAPQLFVAETPATVSEGEVLLDRAGRPRLDSKGQPVKNRWAGIKAVAVIYQADTVNTSNRKGSDRVFPDNTNPENLYPGLISFKTVEEAEELLQRIRACVRHLRQVSKEQASGLQDVDPNVDGDDDAVAAFMGAAS